MSWPGGGSGGTSDPVESDPSVPSSSPLRTSTPGPRLQVQRSLSRDTITIHFSAQGGEEDEDEEELYGPLLDHAGVAAGVEAGEELNSHHHQGAKASSVATTTSAAAVTPAGVVGAAPPHTQSPAVAILKSSPSSSSMSSISSSWPSNAPHQAPALAPTHPLSTSSSPVRAPPPTAAPTPTPASALPSKPFMSPVKSLSSDIEPKEPPGAQPSSSSSTSSARQSHSQPRRHLMKTLVKSLSTDTARPDASDSRHRQFFKQFSQSRPGGGGGHPGPPGDSKTAPSSPLASPLDGRPSSSFFKMSEVETRIEDTRRRLSEVMSEPLQMLNKFMGEEGSSGGGGGSSGIGASGSAGQRTRTLSSSASELTSLAGLNGQSESSSYSIKEEDQGDLEEDGDAEAWREATSMTSAHTTSRTASGCGPETTVIFLSSLSSSSSSPPVPPLPPAATHPHPPPPRSPSLGLERCTMSALVRQEDEEFCELYSEDFEQESDTETEGWHDTATAALRRQSSLTGAYDTDDEDDDADDEDDLEMDRVPGIPHNSLLLLISVVYGYFVLPLPPYVEAVLMGMAAGFMLAILVVWLSAPRHAAFPCSAFPRRRKNRWNLTLLDIKEPGVFKGWMNEILSYDPETYHATLTHSVFVRLEGSTLRLSKPSRNIPRRASFNEAKPSVTYVSQKIYDLTDSKISLVPQSLARKRVWNKKYPICIELGPQEDFMARAQGDKAEAGEDRPSSAGGSAADKPEGSAAAEEGMVRRPSGDLTLYLFGRTGREKEEWFRRILFASRLKSEVKRPASVAGVLLPCHGGLSQSRSSSRGSLEDGQPLLPRPRELPAGLKQKILDYSVYMAQYVSHADTSRPASPSPSATSSPGAGKKLLEGQEEGSESEAWVNALLGRIFWDFLGEKYWADMVSKKIQMKLSKIRLPYFMNELTLTDMDMGITIPKILKSTRPYVDHQGLWFDLEISYHGSFLMSLETKMNLSRLGKEGEGLGELKEGPRMYCLADSDEESSSAGSSDEEETQEVFTDKAVLPGAESYVGGHRPSKIIRFVDKIAKSKYFQKATETEFIKKKMEEVSNTPLLLTVEVQELKGTLAVNIPPPPTDRIWYGFRSPPHLELKARPKLGEREVTFAHVTDWIEKKLDQEFQKIFVMPNMDDIWLPIMHSATDPRSNAALSAMRTDSLKDTELSSDAELSTQSDF
ncbi:testis-expressed protein 2 isoform X2 [Engraulis encrasicolus]|uniref:testis-expressed protein 2 isoform X2 n=1 Tax=Engraulis encrasicolus TaxID=184585 RepID=UPI002FD74992